MSHTEVVTILERLGGRDIPISTLIEEYVKFHQGVDVLLAKRSLNKSIRSARNRGLVIRELKPANGYKNRLCMKFFYSLASSNME